jgi:hypothetical protein
MACPIQITQTFAITNEAMGLSLHGLHYGPSGGRQLQCTMGDHGLTHENIPLHCMQRHDGTTGLSGGIHTPHHMSSRSTQ